MLVLIHDQDDDGAERGRGARPIEAQRGLQARDADGEAGGRNLLAGEAGDEIVVAAAAADRAEADRPAFFVLGFDQQLGFEHGAGVVLEAADDGRVDTNSTVAITCRSISSAICIKFLERPR